MDFSVLNPWLVPDPSNHSEDNKFWVNKSSLTKHVDTYPFIDPYRFQGTLRHKVVVVTLAQRGMGRATANAFAAAGASVVVVGPSAQSLQPVLIEIKQKYGTPALALTADVLDPHTPARIILLAEKHLGPVDILVNISPSAYVRPFAQEQDIMTDWWPMMERTVRTPIAMISAVLPSMIARNTGIIITVTSVAGILNSKLLCKTCLYEQMLTSESCSTVHVSRRRIKNRHPKISPTSPYRDPPEGGYLLRGKSRSYPKLPTRSRRQDHYETRGLCC